MFEFTVDTPDTITVELLQGSGGFEIEIRIGDSTTSFTVKDTGDFQLFEARNVGTIEIKTAGRLQMTVKPKTKPGAAMLDLRQVRLMLAKYILMSFAGRCKHSLVQQIPQAQACGYHQLLDRMKTVHKPPDL